MLDRTPKSIYELAILIETQFSLITARTWDKKFMIKTLANDILSIMTPLIRAMEKSIRFTPHFVACNFPVDDRETCNCGRSDMIQALKNLKGEAMPYSYEDMKKNLFTDNGQKMFIKIREYTNELIKKSGAARMQEIMGACTGDTREMLACVDRMVELGELTELSKPGCFGQHRVFVKTNQ